MSIDTPTVNFQLRREFRMAKHAKLHSVLNRSNIPTEHVEVNAKVQGRICGQIYVHLIGGRLHANRQAEQTHINTSSVASSLPLKWH